MHELGHDLGQRHYGINNQDPGHWYWEDDIKPDYKSMKIGTCNFADYLGENSDQLYWYDEDQQGPPWELSARFGGWEYAYTTSGYSNPQFGLYFGGLWYEVP
jgi:hypothetical protein